MTPPHGSQIRRPDVALVAITADSVLRDLPFLFVYLDDILVASTSKTQHLSHLRLLFQASQPAWSYRQGSQIRLAWAQKRCEGLGRLCDILSCGHKAKGQKLNATKTTIKFVIFCYICNICFGNIYPKQISQNCMFDKTVMNSSFYHTGFQACICTLK